MTKKVLFLNFISLFLIVNTYSQKLSSKDSILIENRKLQKRSVCLLKNENNLIPIKKLDQKIACISIGVDSLSLFQSRLAEYTKIQPINILLTEPEETINVVKEQLKSYDIVICSFHNPEINQGTEYRLTEQMNKILLFLTDSVQSIIVVFGDIKWLNAMKNIHDADGLVIAANESQDFVAQILLGGMELSEKLPKDINEHFKKGDGMSSESIGRLSFVLPEEIGMNSNFIETKVDSIAETGIKEGAFPGCQILAAKDGAIFFHKTYGFHTYDSIFPVRKSDIYDFASVTKITGPLPALMRLYDEGKVKLDTTFSTYWQHFKHSNKKNVSFRDVLAHQARLKAWIPYWKNTKRKNGKFKRRTFKTDSSKKFPVKITEKLYLHKKYKQKIYKAIRKSKLLDKKTYKYSGLSFMLYPEMIENITGKNYESFLKEYFYKPMGAYTLSYNPLSEFKKQQVIKTEIDSFFRMEQIHGTVHDEGAIMMGGISGNAGLFGTTIDLAKIMQMYLNMGSYGGQQFISQETLKEFTKYQFKNNGNRRGLGFDKPLLENKGNGYIAMDASDKSFGHSGFTGTFCWVDPKSGILFIFMSNRVYPTRNRKKIYQLNIRPSLHQVFYDALKKEIIN